MTWGVFMKLSVVIPVYNVERFLRQCLDSVFAQTIKDYEVICVNDGSTDSSLQILREYAKIESNLVVIDQTNHGLGYTRNVGIEHARGDYVAFVDSDDFVAPDMFEKIIRRMEETNAEVAVSNPYIYDMESKEIYPYRNMLDVYRLSLLGGFPAVREPKVFSLLGSWDKVYCRSLLVSETIRFPVNRIYEDAPFSYRALALAKSVTVVKESYYYYRKNAGQAITDKEKSNDAYKFDFLKNAREIKAFLKERQIYDTVAPVFLKYLLHDGMYHHSNATTNRTFLRFFREMRELLDASDGALIRKTRIQKYSWYCDALRQNDLKTCKKMLNKMQNLPDFPEEDPDSEKQ